MSLGLLIIHYHYIKNYIQQQICQIFKYFRNYFGLFCNLSTYNKLQYFFKSFVGGGELPHLLIQTRDI